jgi:polysaccharide biosynthesis protein PslH
MHEPLDILFVSEHPLWPLDQGFRIRGYHMARELAGMGLRVGAASMTPMPPGAADPLRAISIGWPRADDDDVRQLHDGWRGPLSALRRRLVKHQGCDPLKLAGILPLVQHHQPKAVIGLGQHSPMMLRAIQHRSDIRCIWYAADELVSFQLSCLRRERLAAVRHRLHQAALYAALENAFARGLDGAIAVSDADGAMLRRVAGPRRVTTIRNGVDTDYFQPDPHQPPAGRQLVFWGRMDFEPNIDAVTWFAREIWPALRRRHRDAVWHIVGKHPHPRVQALADVPGIRVTGEVEDLRPIVRAAGVAILPMRCGGGIKNKLLEAAAMGLAIAASPRAVAGLDHVADPNSGGAFIICRSPEQWIHGVSRLWSDAAYAQRLCRNALAWVRRCHSWPAAAASLVDWLNTFEHKPASPPIRAAKTAASFAIPPHKEAA